MKQEFILLFFTCFTILQSNVHASPSEFILAALVSDTDPQYYSALDLAVADVNANTTLLPNTKLSLNVQAVFLEALEIEQMIEFSDQDHTLVVGNEFSYLSVLTGVVGNVFGIAQISASATSSALSDTRTYPYFTRVSPPSFGQVFVMFEALLAYEKVMGAGWTEVAIISTTDEFGVDSATIFIENAEEYGFSVLTYQQYLPGSEDFNIELNELDKSGARIIVAFIVEEWDPFIIAAGDYGLVGDDYVWLVPDSVVGVTIPEEEAKKYTRGCLGSFQYIPETGDAYDEFVAHWQAQDPLLFPGAGPDTIPGFYPILGYDTIMTAAQAATKIDELGKLDQQRIPPELWVESIVNLEFDGLSGFIAFDEIGDRKSAFSLSYYDPDQDTWVLCALWSERDGYEQVEDVVWFSGTTQVPDLDIRSPFGYWSCHDKEEGYDSTGKTTILRTPDGSNIDDIDSVYHCDHFIDCKNMSDESVDCSQNFIILFIVFGIITGLLILLAILLVIFVIIFGIILRFRRLRVASPFFLLLILFSIIIGYFSIFAWFGKPHPVACAFQPWLLGLPVISMVVALCVKVFRIWRIFKNGLKRQTITDAQLLIIWFILMLPALFIVTLWTAISTPTASIIERNGEDHYVCNTGGVTGEPGGLVFFFLLVAYGAIILLIGIFLSIVTRKVPSLFNESKLLSISIYNLGFLSIVIIPVFLVVGPFNPFLAWILRTIAILYAFTATLTLQFLPAIIGIFILDKCRNPSPNLTKTMSSSKSNTNSTSGFA